jgi:hypothetical protein
MKCPYKSFKQYYIEPMLKWIDKIPRNAYVRLYVDESVIDDEDFKELYDKKIRNLEIVFYQYDDFYDKDPNYDGSICPKYERFTQKTPNGYAGHDGTFGSIVRLLPFYKEYRPKYIKYVWITDIDLAFKSFINFFVRFRRPTRLTKSHRTFHGTFLKNISYFFFLHKKKKKLKIIISKVFTI